MEGLMSFPNAVCLMLAGLLVTHLLSQDPLTSPPGPDHPEDAYCCLGHSPRPAATCSSPASIFYACATRRPTSERNQTEEVETEPESGKEEEQKVQGQNFVFIIKPKEQDNRKQEDARAVLVNVIVFVLLLMLAGFGVQGWFCERERSRRGVDGEADGDGGADGRRISMAELTFNRHVRRGESTNHAQAHHHFNGTPIGSRGPLSLLKRRSSFPAQLPEPCRTHPPPRRQQSSPGLPLSVPSGRRLSVDLDNEGSPARIRVRIIRRH